MEISSAGKATSTFHKAQMRCLAFITLVSFILRRTEKLIFLDWIDSATLLPLRDESNKERSKERSNNYCSCHLSSSFAND
ncbi:hypothetical protein HMPREF2550_02740 [Corynebacterium sp. HMSC074A01]|nr:hypothetical protein HMPREF2550_02740 [Corynebacterium sp. HMSC074A01]